MNKTAIIFVDANNWYHNVKKFYTPSDIDINKVAEFVCKERDYSLIEIRWYASVPSISDGEKMYYRHMEFLSFLKNKGVTVITRKLQRFSNKEVLIRKAALIESLDLCEKCKPLVESTFLDMSDLKKKEKGIDVWIAIDMLKLSLIEKKCDVCVLISGDADFVPALELIKQNGREVLSVSVPLGYSSELITKFPYIFLRKASLLECLINYKDAKNYLKK